MSNIVWNRNLGHLLRTHTGPPYHLVTTCPPPDCTNPAFANTYTLSDMTGLIGVAACSPGSTGTCDWGGFDGTLVRQQAVADCTLSPMANWANTQVDSHGVYGACVLAADGVTVLQFGQIILCCSGSTPYWTLHMVVDWCNYDGSGTSYISNGPTPAGTYTLDVYDPNASWPATVTIS